MNLWKCRAVENMENQTAVSHVSHRAWKSGRDFHIPTGPTAASFTNENKYPRLVPCGHSPEKSCQNQTGQVITILVLSAFPLAGFEVTAIGRI